MVVHESANVAQKQGSDDRNTTPRNTGQVDISVRSRVRLLSGQDHSIVKCIVARDTRNELDLVWQSSTSEFDDLHDDRGRCDVGLDEHPANILCGVWGEFAEEDIVIDGVTDTSTDDAYAQSSGQVLVNRLEAALSGSPEERLLTVQQRLRSGHRGIRSW